MTKASNSRPPPRSRASNRRGSPGPTKQRIEVPGAGGVPRRLTLSNLDKVLWLATGFTKAAVVDDDTRIAPVMLPHLRNRTVTMVRRPEGRRDRRPDRARAFGNLYAPVEDPPELPTLA